MNRRTHRPDALTTTWVFKLSEPVLMAVGGKHLDRLGFAGIAENGPIHIGAKFLTTNTGQSLYVWAMLCGYLSESPLMDNRVAGEIERFSQGSDAPSLLNSPAYGCGFDRHATYSS